MCVYLNALAGQKYFACNHSQLNIWLVVMIAWMGEIYRFLGLTVGVNTRDLKPGRKHVMRMHVILHIQQTQNLDLITCVTTWLRS